jgi:hypothetical protein
MINLVNTGKQSGKCRITFYKMTDTCVLYDNPGADSSVQKVEQKGHDSFYEAEDDNASNAAIEMLNSSSKYRGVRNWWLQENK